VTATALGSVGAAVVSLAEDGLSSGFRIVLFLAAGAAILSRVPIVVVLLTGAIAGLVAGALGVV
jgi:hypothetical protein